MNYRQSVTLPIEFRLALACCRWAFAGGSGDSVQEAARQVDWERFVAVVRRHRVEGLMWHSLEALAVPLPPAIAQSLSASARSIAEHGLRVAAESARLLRSFEQAGIDLLFIKGLTLGKLAYSSPFIKMSWDVDLLVPRARIADAAALLDDMGYVCISPERTVDRLQLEAWHRRHKESAWYNDARTVHLELHGRLPDSPALIPDVGIGSPRQRVEVAPGIFLPTLARDELFAYLCVHGAQSGWHRLKWLADFAALLHDLDEVEMARLYATSQALGAGRAAGQALLLARLLFDSDIGEKLARKLDSDRPTRWLVRIALHLIVGRADLKEPTEVRLGTLGIHVSQLLVAPGWKEKGLEFGRKLSVFLSNARAARAGTVE